MNPNQRANPPPPGGSRGGVPPAGSLNAPPPPHRPDTQLPPHGSLHHAPLSAPSHVDPRAPRHEATSVAAASGSAAVSSSRHRTAPPAAAAVSAAVPSTSSNAHASSSAPKVASPTAMTSVQRLKHVARRCIHLHSSASSGSDGTNTSSSSSSTLQNLLSDLAPCFSRSALHELNQALPSNITTLLRLLKMIAVRLMAAEPFAHLTVITGVLQMLWPMAPVIAHLDRVDVFEHYTSTLQFFLEQDRHAGDVFLSHVLDNAIPAEEPSLPSQSQASNQRSTSPQKDQTSKDKKASKALGVTPRKRRGKYATIDDANQSATNTRGVSDSGAPNAGASRAVDAGRLGTASSAFEAFTAGRQLTSSDVVAAWGEAHDELRSSGGAAGPSFGLRSTTSGQWSRRPSHGSHTKDTEDAKRRFPTGLLHCGDFALCGAMLALHELCFLGQNLTALPPLMSPASPVAFPILVSAVPSKLATAVARACRSSHTPSSLRTYLPGGGGGSRLANDGDADAVDDDDEDGAVPQSAPGADSSLSLPFRFTGWRDNISGPSSTSAASVKAETAASAAAAAFDAKRAAFATSFPVLAFGAIELKGTSEWLTATVAVLGTIHNIIMEVSEPKRTNAGKSTDGTEGSSRDGASGGSAASTLQSGMKEDVSGSAMSALAATHSDRCRTTAAVATTHAADALLDASGVPSASTGGAAAPGHVDYTDMDTLSRLLGDLDNKAMFLPAAPRGSAASSPGSAGAENGAPNMAGVVASLGQGQLGKRSATVSTEMLALFFETALQCLRVPPVHSWIATAHAHVITFCAALVPVAFKNNASGAAVDFAAGCAKILNETQRRDDNNSHPNSGGGLHRRESTSVSTSAAAQGRILSMQEALATILCHTSDLAGGMPPAASSPMVEGYSKAPSQVIRTTLAVLFPPTSSLALGPANGSDGKLWGEVARIVSTSASFSAGFGLTAPSNNSTHSAPHSSSIGMSLADILRADTSSSSSTAEQARKRQRNSAGDSGGSGSAGGNTALSPSLSRLLRLGSGPLAALMPAQDVPEDFTLNFAAAAAAVAHAVACEKELAAATGHLAVGSSSPPPSEFPPPPVVGDRTSSGRLVASQPATGGPGASGRWSHGSPSGAAPGRTDSSSSEQQRSRGPVLMASGQPSQASVTALSHRLITAFTFLSVISEQCWSDEKLTVDDNTVSRRERRLAAGLDPSQQLHHPVCSTSSTTSASVKGLNIASSAAENVRAVYDADGLSIRGRLLHATTTTPLREFLTLDPTVAVVSAEDRQQYHGGGSGPAAASKAAACGAASLPISGSVEEMWRGILAEAAVESSIRSSSAGSAAGGASSVSLAGLTQQNTGGAAGAPDNGNGNRLASTPSLSTVAFDRSFKRAISSLLQNRSACDNEGGTILSLCRLFFTQRSAVSSAARAAASPSVSTHLHLGLCEDEIRAGSFSTSPNGGACLGALAHRDVVSSSAEEAAGGIDGRQACTGCDLIDEVSAAAVHFTATRSTLDRRSAEAARGGPGVKGLGQGCTRPGNIQVNASAAVGSIAADLSAQAKGAVWGGDAQLETSSSDDDEHNASCFASRSATFTGAQNTNGHNATVMNEFSAHGKRHRDGSMFERNGGGGGGGWSIGSSSAAGLLDPSELLSLAVPPETVAGLWRVAASICHELPAVAVRMLRILSLLQRSNDGLFTPRSSNSPHHAQSTMIAGSESNSNVTAALYKVTASFAAAGTARDPLSIDEATALVTDAASNALRLAWSPCPPALVADAFAPFGDDVLPTLKALVEDESVKLSTLMASSTSSTVSGGHHPGQDAAASTRGARTEETTMAPAVGSLSLGEVCAAATTYVACERLTHAMKGSSQDFATATAGGPGHHHGVSTHSPGVGAGGHGVSISVAPFTSTLRASTLQLPCSSLSEIVRRTVLQRNATLESAAMTGFAFDHWLDPQRNSSRDDDAAVGTTSQAKQLPAAGDPFLGYENRLPGRRQPVRNDDLQIDVPSASTRSGAASPVPAPTKSLRENLTAALPTATPSSSAPGAASISVSRIHGGSMAAVEEATSSALLSIIASSSRSVSVSVFPPQIAALSAVLPPTAAFHRDDVGFLLQSAVAAFASSGVANAAILKLMDDESRVLSSSRRAIGASANVFAINAGNPPLVSSVPTPLLDKSVSGNNSNEGEKKINSLSHDAAAIAGLRLFDLAADPTVHAVASIAQGATLIASSSLHKALVAEFESVLSSLGSAPSNATTSPRPSAAAAVPASTDDSVQDRRFPLTIRTAALISTLSSALSSLEEAASAAVKRYGLHTTLEAQSSASNNGGFDAAKCENGEQQVDAGILSKTTQSIASAYTLLSALITAVTKAVVAFSWEGNDALLLSLLVSSSSSSASVGVTSDAATGSATNADANDRVAGSPVAALAMSVSTPKVAEAARRSRPVASANVALCRAVLALQNTASRLDVVDTSLQTFGDLQSSAVSAAGGAVVGGAGAGSRPTPAAPAPAPKGKKGGKTPKKRGRGQSSTRHEDVVEVLDTPPPPVAQQLVGDSSNSNEVVCIDETPGRPSTTNATAASRPSHAVVDGLGLSDIPKVTERALAGVVAPAAVRQLAVIAQAAAAAAASLARDLPHFALMGRRFERKMRGLTAPSSPLDATGQQQQQESVGGGAGAAATDPRSPLGGVKSGPSEIGSHPVAPTPTETFASMLLSALAATSATAAQCIRQRRMIAEHYRQKGASPAEVAAGVQNNDKELNRRASVKAQALLAAVDTEALRWQQVRAPSLQQWLSAPGSINNTAGDQRETRHSSGPDSSRCVFTVDSDRSAARFEFECHRPQSEQAIATSFFVGHPVCLTNIAHRSNNGSLTMAGGLSLLQRAILGGILNELKTIDRLSASPAASAIAPAAAAGAVPCRMPSSVLSIAAVQVLAVEAVVTKYGSDLNPRAVTSLSTAMMSSAVEDISNLFASTTRAATDIALQLPITTGQTAKENAKDSSSSGGRSSGGSDTSSRGVDGKEVLIFDAFNNCEEAVWSVSEDLREVAAALFQATGAPLLIPAHLRVAAAECIGVCVSRGGSEGITSALFRNRQTSDEAKENNAAPSTAKTSESAGCCFSNGSGSRASAVAHIFANRFADLERESAFFDTADADGIDHAVVSDTVRSLLLATQTSDRASNTVSPVPSTSPSLSSGSIVLLDGMLRHRDIRTALRSSSLSSSTIATSSNATATSASSHQENGRIAFTGGQLWESLVDPRFVTALRQRLFLLLGEIAHCHGRAMTLHGSGPGAASSATTSPNPVAPSLPPPTPGNLNANGGGENGTAALRSPAAAIAVSLVISEKAALLDDIAGILRALTALASVIASSTSQCASLTKGVIQTLTRHACGGVTFGLSPTTANSSTSIALGAPAATTTTGDSQQRRLPALVATLPVSDLFHALVKSGFSAERLLGSSGGASSSGTASSGASSAVVSEKELLRSMGLAQGRSFNNAGGNADIAVFESHVRSGGAAVPAFVASAVKVLGIADASLRSAGHQGLLVIANRLDVELSRLFMPHCAEIFADALSAVVHEEKQNIGPHDKLLTPGRATLEFLSGLAALPLADTLRFATNDIGELLIGRGDAKALGVFSEITGIKIETLATQSAPSVVASAFVSILRSSDTEGGTMASAPPLKLLTEDEIASGMDTGTGGGGGAIVPSRAKSTAPSASNRMLLTDAHLAPVVAAAGVIAKTVPQTSIAQFIGGKARFAIRFLFAFCRSRFLSSASQLREDHETAVALLGRAFAVLRPAKNLSEMTKHVTKFGWSKDTVMSTLRPEAFALVDLVSRGLGAQEDVDASVGPPTQDVRRHWLAVLAHVVLLLGTSVSHIGKKLPPLLAHATRVKRATALVASATGGSKVDTRAAPELATFFDDGGTAMPGGLPGSSVQRSYDAKGGHQKNTSSSSSRPSSSASASAHSSLFFSTNLALTSDASIVWELFIATASESFLKANAAALVVDAVGLEAKLVMALGAGYRDADTSWACACTCRRSPPPTTATTTAAGASTGQRADRKESSDMCASCTFALTIFSQALCSKPLTCRRRSAQKSPQAEAQAAQPQPQVIQRGNAKVTRFVPPQRQAAAACANGQNSAVEREVVCTASVPVRTAARVAFSALLASVATVHATKPASPLWLPLAVALAVSSPVIAAFFFSTEHKALARAAQAELMVKRNRIRASVVEAITLREDTEDFSSAETQAPDLAAARSPGIAAQILRGCTDGLADRSLLCRSVFVRALATFLSRQAVLGGSCTDSTAVSASVSAGAATGATAASGRGSTGGVSVPRVAASINVDDDVSTSGGGGNASGGEDVETDFAAMAAERTFIPNSSATLAEIAALPEAKAMMRDLLACAASDPEPIRTHALFCVGAIGAHSPQLPRRISVKPELEHFSSHHVTGWPDFVSILLGRYCLNALNTTGDDGMHDRAAFAIQTLLRLGTNQERIMAQAPEIEPGRGVRAEDLERYMWWKKLPVDSRAALGAFAATTFETRVVESRTKVVPEFRTAAMGYVPWLQNWFLNLIDRTVGVHGQIFEAIRNVARRDTSLMEFTLPVLLLNVLVGGSEDDANDLVQEFTCVFETTIKASGVRGHGASNARESHHSNANTRSSGRRSERGIPANPAPGSGPVPVAHTLTLCKCVEAVVRFCEDLVKDDLAVKDKSSHGEKQQSAQRQAAVEKLREWLGRIGTVRLAEAALSIGSHARALKFLEMAEVLPSITEHSGLMQRVFAGLDDPDGVKTVHRAAPASENWGEAALAHEHAGEWVEAQQCAELQLQQHPGDVPAQLCALRCLQRQGQMYHMAQAAAAISTSAAASISAQSSALQGPNARAAESSVNALRQVATAITSTPSRRQGRNMHVSGRDLHGGGNTNQGQAGGRGAVVRALQFGADEAAELCAPDDGVISQLPPIFRGDDGGLQDPAGSGGSGLQAVLTQSMPTAGELGTNAGTSSHHMPLEVRVRQFAAEAAWQLGHWDTLDALGPAGATGVPGALRALETLVATRSSMASNSLGTFGGGGGAGSVGGSVPMLTPSLSRATGERTAAPALLPSLQRVKSICSAARRKLARGIVASSGVDDIAQRYPTYLSLHALADIEAAAACVAGAGASPDLARMVNLNQSPTNTDLNANDAAGSSSTSSGRRNPTRVFARRQNENVALSPLSSAVSVSECLGLSKHFSIRTDFITAAPEARDRILAVHGSIFQLLGQETLAARAWLEHAELLHGAGRVDPAAHAARRAASALGFLDPGVVSSPTRRSASVGAGGGVNGAGADLTGASALSALQAETATKCYALLAQIAHDRGDRTGAAAFAAEHSSNVDLPHELRAKLFLLSAKWADDGRTLSPDAIGARFKRALDLHGSEEGFHAFGLFLDKQLVALHQSINAQAAAPAGAATPTASVGVGGSAAQAPHEHAAARRVEAAAEYAPKILEYYGQALRHGILQAPLSLPRLFTCWLDTTQMLHWIADGKSSGEPPSTLQAAATSGAGATMVGAGSRVTLSSQVRTAAANLITKLNDHVTMSLVAPATAAPACVVMTALPQVISRLGHTSIDVVSVLTKLLQRLLTAYPQPTLWALLAVIFSASGRTRQRYVVKDVLDPFKAANPKEGVRLLNLAEGIFKCMIDICQAKIEKSISDAEVARQLFARKLTEILKDCRFIMPVQRTLTPNLINAAAGVTGRGPMPPTATAAPGARGSGRSSVPERSGLFGSGGRARVVGRAAGEIGAEAADPAFSTVFERAPTFDKFSTQITVMASLQKPKKVTMITPDRQSVHFLCKAKDEPRKDMRMMELASTLNSIFLQNPETRRRDLYMRRYAVTALTDDCAMIEWVDHVIPLRSITDELYVGRKKGVSLSNIKTMKDKADKGACTPLELLTNHLMPKFPPLMHHWIQAQFPQPAEWHAARNRFSKTLATWSMVGHIVGLGDRHGENLLLDQRTGDVCHVDFACMFDKGETLEVAERVRFRLTQNVVDGLGVTGKAGSFSAVCELVLQEQYRRRDMIMGVLETFIHDPLVEWSTTRSSSGREKAGPRQLLARVERRLDGFVDLYGEPRDTVALSAEGQVLRLVEHASSPETLCQMYIWWMPWV